MKSFLSAATTCRLYVHNALSKVWLIGQLFQTSRKTYAGALYEFVYLLIWSVFPFVLAGLVQYITSTEDNKDLIFLVVSTFKNGELLVFTISLVAPVLYLTLHDPEDAKSFPHKLPLSTISFLVLVFSAAVFSIIKASQSFDKELVFEMSLVLTLIALIMRFLAMLYHKSRLPEKPEEVFREKQRSFVESFKSHVGDQP